jgi:fibronectin type 3 domain-containing protein/archaellum component FlaG (FlaF/FlaG flagellin family)
MRKAFLLLAALALLAGCEQPTDGDTGNEVINKITFTIKNESSYDLSSVKWSDVSFASNNAGDLLKAASATKEVKENDTGYINFTRKDIGIELRTELTYSQSDSSATITDNTVVIEVGNVSSRGILREIAFLPRLEVERNALQVVKNDVVNIGESTINTSKQILFSIKNTGKGKLIFTGNEPVKSSDPAFMVIQPSGSEIAPGASLEFKVNFIPTMEKAYIAAVTISSNDKAGDFIFTVSGNGAPPKPIIGIFYDSAEILQSGTIDGGEALLTQSKTVEITIKNSGSISLILDTSAITITGIDAAAFSLATQPSQNISAGNESKFFIQCTPAKLGENSAIITIPTNDTARNPAVFYIKVTGLVAPPDELSVSSVTFDSITLSWGPAAEAMGYLVYRSAGSDGLYAKITTSAVTATSYTNTGLSAGTTYYYKVSTVNGDRESEKSAYVFALTVPSAPADVGVVTASSRSIRVSWSAATGAESYNIYRSDTAAGTYDQVGTSATTSYTDTALQLNSSYYYKVSALNSGGESIPSIFVSGTTTLSAPTDLSVSAQTVSSLTINWSLVPGASSYRIYRSAAFDGLYNQIGTPAAASYTDTGLSSGTRYYYKVSAVDNEAESAQSVSVSGTTRLSAPSGLNVSSAATGSITLNWSSVPEASSYKVYRSTRADSTSYPYNQIGTSVATSYTDTGLSAGTTYYYKVVAVNGGEESDKSGYISALPVPSAPAGVSVVTASSSSIRVSWSTVTGAESYNIYRSDTSTGAYGQVGTSAATSYTDTALQGNSNYYYKVSALNSGGEGILSIFVSGTTTLSAPTGLYWVYNGYGYYQDDGKTYYEVEFYWDSVPGASSYRLYHSTAINGTYSLFEGTTYTTNMKVWFDDDSDIGKIYYFKVVAIDNGIESVKSDYVAVKL